MESQNNCIFCQIATGKLDTPGKFWENDDFAAMLSIDPNTEGFSVVLPKQHYPSDVLHLPSEVLKNFIFAAQEVASRLERTFSDVGRVGLIMEGTGVDHAHIKLIPMHHTEYLKDGWRAVSCSSTDWFDTYPGWLSSAPGPRADSEALAELAKRIIEKNKHITI